MAPDTYAELKSAECVVRSNLERGRVKEAQHELLKMKRVLEARFAHELSEFDQMLNTKRDWELLEERTRLRDAQIEITALKASLAEAKGTTTKLAEMLEEANGNHHASQSGKIIDFRRLGEH